ncbi:type II toxin-antitoxin system RelE family toxin [Salinicoccus kekensis]|uniref:Addiction module RelE/StbE family toxin n=1 Tax=Salinicoccus kekensis TaxID=714307 RepID=A0A285UMZ1_9STAP|nr:type II toxin-antitoxin system RelE/ParE family toxin [Salinicoccus kekensis]SOC41601.1 addiction module RelE/StbE family toxin [Salinicoccus kekensis]
MKYRVVYEKRAIKSLAKIDKGQQRMIISWIEKNLQNSNNPKHNGKALKGQLKEYWRYRVGNYRILAEINENEVKIVIINIGHRKDIYKL